MANLNAALGCSQMENLNLFIKKKNDTLSIFKIFK